MNPITSQPAKLTLCITELDIGGAEKALVRIATGLQNKNWNVAVISLRDRGPLTDSLEQQGIPVTALNCGGFGDIRTYGRLKSAIRKNRPDMLLTFLHQANIYGRLAARAVGVRKVVSGVRVADRRRWVAITDRLTKRFCDHYIAVSQNVAQVHASQIGLDPQFITAIPNGVDIPDNQSSSIAAEETNHQLLFVGRLTDQKAPLDLLEAFLLLPDKRRQQTSVTFVGDGPLRTALQDRITAAGVRSSVSLVGWQPDIMPFMQEASLLVLPSRWEGLPNVVLEAMAIGLPVVCSDVDGCRELVDSGATGILVPPQSPEQLAKAIEGLLSHPDTRCKMAEAAQSVVRKHFSWSGCVEHYNRTLMDLLAQP